MTSAIRQPGAWFAWLLVVLAAMLPASSMIRSSMASAVYYAMILTVLACLLQPAMRRAVCAEPEWQRWRPLAWGAGLFLLLVVVAQAANGSLPDSGLEKTLRFALMVPLVLMFRVVDVRRLQHVQWGLVGAALLFGGLLIFPPVLDGTRPYTAMYSRYNAVEFGNLAMLFGVLCIFLCDWRVTRHVRLEVLVKLLAAFVALYGFVLSATRTGWLAAPLFLLIGGMLILRRSWQARMVALVVTVVFLVLAATMGTGLKTRVEVGVSELTQCHEQPLTDSSICIRLQLARAATNLFQESPWVGVGTGERFRDSLQEQAQKGAITPFVAAHYGEPHNDLLHYLAGYGILGVAGALLFIYVLPAWYFARFFMAAPEGRRRLAAAMGLVVCLGFAAFGLTEMMFRSMVTASLYSVWVAVLLALAAPERHVAQGARTMGAGSRHA
jgi:O-antigen ligase